ncbi:SIS domain-containing protein [Dokdonella fugitiva]|uniref:SIS domain-containing protein n=1 Tax=Dokdonella fugitiva TaxID=328517 RepID=UPI0017AC1FA2|nr:SIS domain-containing protein [Dokdonella fugitiva]MBA8885432.1 glucosamine--fructose-6-phosphate aminotransferase (isomerizing) [Dokdonella fugitiva]
MSAVPEDTMPDTTAAAESTRMYREIRESAAAIARQLEANRGVIGELAARLRRERPSLVATGARGSSDNAATFAKYLVETRLGVATTSAAPSVQSVYAARTALDGALFLAISQSGKSPDLVAQASAAREAGARVVAMVNVVESPLAAAADVVVPLHAGPELSVAATKSYLCSLSALLHLVAEWTGDTRLRDALAQVPDALEAGWHNDWSALVDGLAEARNLFVVGRGFGLSAAQEVALKFKETCGLHAEAFSAAEVQHGPMTLVERGFPVLFFAQHDDSYEGTMAVAGRFRERDARVWVAAPDGGELPFAATGDPACAPLLAVHRCYGAINALALRRGRDPDAPPHLRKVTETR